MTITELYSEAIAGTLPCHKAAGVLCPSGRICMDWNTAVKGAWRFAKWAKVQVPVRADIIDKERADLEFLCTRVQEARKAVRDAKVERARVLGSPGKDAKTVVRAHSTAKFRKNGDADWEPYKDT